MRKQTKVILSVIILLALLAAAFAAVLYYRHEQEQNRAIHELNEQVIGLLEEENEQSASETKIAGLEGRIAELESRYEKDMTESDPEDTAGTEPEEDPYGLDRTDGIEIPVFTEENMKAFDIPDEQMWALQNGEFYEKK